MFLLPHPILPFTFLNLRSPPSTISLAIPSNQHHRLRPFVLPISTRSRASLSSASSSKEEEPVVSVLSVLRSHGIPEDACASFLSQCPERFRRMKPLKTLNPKLQFLRSSSVGLSGVEVGEIILANPYILAARLHPTLSSSVSFLASILPSTQVLVKVLKSLNRLNTDHMKANLQVLRDRGATDGVILKIFLMQPRSLSRPADDFVAALETIEKKLGIGPTSTRFVAAVAMASYLSKETFSRKVGLLKEMGWSEEQVLSVLRKQPRCLNVSDDRLRKIIAYSQDVLGWGPEDLSSFPQLLSMNLEAKIIPRCAVLNVLMTKGLRKKQTRFFSRYTIGEERFFADYIDKYKEQFPEVLEAYQGKIQFTGWDWLKVSPEEAVVRSDLTEEQQHCS